MNNIYLVDIWSQFTEPYDALNEIIEQLGHIVRLLSIQYCIGSIIQNILIFKVLVDRMKLKKLKTKYTCFNC